MRIPTLHRWPRTAKAAIQLQKHLAPLLRLEPIIGTPRLFAGADVANCPDGRWTVAGVVVWDAQSRRIVEQRAVRRPCRFPYIPGLLSFRETPALLAAFRKLRITPDVVLCDAQGLAHPRRLGLACHLGLWLGIPTVGCAKSRLCGDFSEPGPARGSASLLTLDGEAVGDVLRTRDGVKPLYVSPGHLCDRASACRVTLAATGPYRLPEPTRLAHQLVGRARGAGAG